MTKNDFDIEKTVLEYMDEALDTFENKKVLRKLLIEPDREIKMDLPVKLDNGGIDTFKAYRVQHSDLMGPYKGGLRMVATGSDRLFRALAMMMTFKLSLFDLPFGGAKGGLIADTKTLSSNEKKRLIEKYIEELDCLIGAGSDIPAPDMGTGPEEMALIEKILKSRDNKASNVTGKPVANGGIKFTEIATGYGVAHAVDLATTSFLRNKKDFRVAIQGFGNVGAVAAKRIALSNKKIISISDHSGALHCEQGLNVRRLSDLSKKFGSLKELASQQDIDFTTNDEMLGLDTDILVPAAKEGLLNQSNAKNISASIIVEGANVPCSSFASKYFQDQDIMVVPGLFANAGGVIGSFFEWEIDNGEDIENTTKLGERLEKMMNMTWKKITSKFDKEESLRQICYKISLENLAERYQKRGYRIEA